MISKSRLQYLVPNFGPVCATDCCDTKNLTKSATELRQQEETGLELKSKPEFTHNNVLKVTRCCCETGNVESPDSL